jgi:hypothetical protein
MNAGRLTLVLALLCGGCAATATGDANRATLAAAASEILPERGPGDPQPDLRLVERDLQGLLARAARRGDATERFWASWLLAQLHAEASLGEAFRYERSAAGGRVGGVGTRVSSGGTERPSETSHLVAAVFHAAEARSLFEPAVRAAGGALPAELSARDLDDADDNLQLLLLVVYSRLGFADEAARLLEGSPVLRDPAACMSLMESFDLRAGLRPWVCRAIWHDLAPVDPELAYRFAVLAVEGTERFGRGLPRAEVDRIEAWIGRDAPVLFVCPESRTPYLPGQTRSPVSGVPHFDYVAVERPSAD